MNTQGVKIAGWGPRENCRQRATINKNMRTMLKRRENGYGVGGGENGTETASNIDFNMAAHTHTHKPTQAHTQTQ